MRSSLKFICVCGWVGFVNYCLLGCLIGGGIFYLIHQHTCCGAMYSCGYRRKLRLKYGLPEQPCGDYCTDCCCLPCSLSQQTRELKIRGVDPNLGKKKHTNPLPFKLQTLSLFLSLLLGFLFWVSFSFLEDGCKRLIQQCLPLPNKGCVALWPCHLH
jgi:Cys-rich protein (TIGR01571 family)